MEQYKVVSNHEIFEDDFIQGEGIHVNFFTLRTNVKAESPQEAINKHLEEVGYNLDFKNCEVSDCGQFVQTSCLVNSDNCQASNTELKRWETGDLVLYSDNISMEVYKLKEVNFKI